MSRVKQGIASTFGGIAASAGFAGIGAGLFKALSEAATFDSALTDLAISANMLGSEGAAGLKVMEDAARRAGATTKFTATESAQALNNLVLGGLDPTTQAVNALNPTLTLATATNMELARSATVIVDAMGRYGLEASEASKVTDFLVRSQQLANTTADQMSEALGAMGTSAAFAGISFRDTVAVLTTMAKGGERGSEAGTALRIGLQRLSETATKTTKESRDLRDQLLALGFDVTEFVDDAGKITDIVALFEALAKSTRKKEIEALFGARGARIGSIIGVLANPKTADFARRTIRELDKAAESQLGLRAAEAKMKDFMGNLKTLFSALGEVAISVFRPILRAIIPVVQGIASLARGFAVMNESAMDGVVGFVKELLAMESVQKNLEIATFRLNQAWDNVSRVFRVIAKEAQRAFVQFLEVTGIKDRLDLVSISAENVVNFIIDKFSDAALISSEVFEILVINFNRIMGIVVRSVELAGTAIVEAFQQVGIAILKIFAAVNQQVILFAAKIPELILQAAANRMTGGTLVAFVEDAMSGAMNEAIRGISNVGRSSVEAFKGIRFEGTAKELSKVSEDIQDILNQIAFRRIRRKPFDPSPSVPGVAGGAAPETGGGLKRKTIDISTRRLSVDRFLPVGRQGFSEFASAIQDNLLKMQETEADEILVREALESAKREGKMVDIAEEEHEISKKMLETMKRLENLGARVSTGVGV